MTDYKMTDEDKKRIFGYMGWLRSIHNIPGMAWEIYDRRHPLDGNDMVAAMNKMVEKGDWTDFFQDCWNIYVYTDADANYIHWLMQPTRFFELMASWLKEKEHEKSY